MRTSDVFLDERLGCYSTVQREDERTRAAVVAVLAEVDALPGADREAAAGDRQRERRAEQRRLDVGGHVVGALDRVGPVARVLGDGLVEVGLEVVAHVGRGVLVERQRGAGVADEDVQQPDLEALELGHGLEHVARDQVKAARPRPQGDLPLDPHRALTVSGRRACPPSRRGTARPRPRAARAGARPWPATPSARTIRHHGTSSSVRKSTVPAKRGAPGRDVAVGAHEALRHVADPRAARLGRSYRAPRMRHGTYSIVALDPATGELGVAVQSHWFSVGPLCAWARAGVGAVATQSVVEPAYGPNALDRLADGVPRAAGARRAARRRPAAGRAPGRGDRRARPARRRTPGADCIAHAAHVTGEHHSCQANMMQRETVPGRDVGRVHGRRPARCTSA